MSVPRAARAAFVSEEISNEGRMSSRFRAHWEGRHDVAAHGDGPSDLCLSDAVAWGREHAPVVWVVIDDDHYSAGEEHPDGDVPRWPAGGIEVRSRPFGTPFDGSVQVVPHPFQALIEAEGDPEPLARELRTLVAVRAGDVEARITDEQLIELHFPVPASSVDAAMAGADAWVDAALRDCSGAGWTHQVGTDHSTVDERTGRRLDG